MLVLRFEVFEYEMDGMKLYELLVALLYEVFNGGFNLIKDTMFIKWQNGAHNFPQLSFINLF